jgi:fumarate hydratase class I
MEYQLILGKGIVKLMQDLTNAFVELIRRASTLLPPDMEQALHHARENEEPGSAAQGALDTIIENVEISRANNSPICQDTGTPLFEIYYPIGVSTRQLADQIRQACATSTERGYLRPNAVDGLSGKNSGNNTGVDFPTMHFHEWEEEGLKATVQLKGGGCENVSIQYDLPNTELNAGRDLEGVRRVVLDGVNKAQGLGCAPGVLGIAIGGDRGASYIKSKQQLLRPLPDTNPEPSLAQLEERLMEETNELGIGPMGFGGKTTVLGVKIGTLHRLPASFFVSIAYMCWANRRASMRVIGEEITYA